MNPSPNRQAVIVGLFITAALILLAGGVLTIGNLNDTFSHKITVSAIFDEVGGLKKGDNIWFSGLKVGTVKNLAFLGNAQVVVLMKIDQEAMPFIHKDALAKISSDGLIGNKIVVLYNGTPDAPTLQDGDVLAIGKAVSTEEIMGMLQENNANLLAITTDLRGISGQLVSGQGSLAKLLKDEGLYQDIVETVGTLKVASNDTRHLTRSLSVFASKLNQPGHLPHDLLSDQTSYTALTTTVSDLQQTSTQVSNLVDSFAQSTANPATPFGTLIYDAQAGTDLKVTLNNLSLSSALLTEDLEALQHNFLFRGFFRRKERAEQADASTH